jgi:hypothetical protein
MLRDDTESEVKVASFGIVPRGHCATSRIQRIAVTGLPIQALGTPFHGSDHTMRATRVAKQDHGVLAHGDSLVCSEQEGRLAGWREGSRERYRTGGSELSDEHAVRQHASVIDIGIEKDAKTVELACHLKFRGRLASSEFSTICLVG